MFSTTTMIDETCHVQIRPATLLACGDNFMPLSWHMPVSKSPLRYAIAVRDENKTYDLLHKKREFSLNFLDYSHIKDFQLSGSVHGSDKFKLTGLHPKKAEHISTTLIEEAYMIYECRVLEIHSFGDHDIFISEVLCIHNRNIKGVAPTLFLGKGYYETTTQNPQRVSRDIL